MSANLIVRLYPAAFRSAWEEDLAVEVAHAGPRAWPALLGHAASAWLHPAYWPSPRPALRLRRAGQLVLVAIAAATLALYAAADDVATFDRPVPHAALVLDLCALLTGALLTAPTPRLNPGAVTHAAVALTRHLGPALALGAVVVLAAHLPSADPSVFRLPLVLMWWWSLALGAARCCRAVAVLDEAALHIPGPLRLQAGLCVTVAALILAIGLLIVNRAAAQADQLVVAVSCLAAAVALCLTTLRDVRDLPST
jgi:hypothetical protein